MDRFNRNPSILRFGRIQSNNSIWTTIIRGLKLLNNISIMRRIDGIWSSWKLSFHCHYFCIFVDLFISIYLSLCFVILCFFDFCVDFSYLSVFQCLYNHNRHFINDKSNTYFEWTEQKKTLYCLIAAHNIPMLAE